MVEPSVVNTVSNVSVSVEKFSLADELVVIRSFLQEEKRNAALNIKNSIGLSFFIVRKNGKDHFLLGLLRRLV